MKEQTGAEPQLLPVSSPALSLHAGGAFSLPGRGSIALQHPAVLFGWETALGVGSVPRLGAAQRTEPCVTVTTQSPFLSFSAGSFLRPNALLTPSSSSSSLHHSNPPAPVRTKHSARASRAQIFCSTSAAKDMIILLCNNTVM